ncbi:uncharacterized protein LACBIDRAFT_306769 [Laccaria bicolor S238N-H82]|uniref:Predicted protein n=1 Tax=Laccaria bicolor (strain S238N-H82 / ATCC MYA-4686) TaxID=486041 RepID=B0DNN2_LACBS|nr:uncharacterized protein LACBIDRAFT_306769 [Laccaria bicolor S238N-H82]EDR03685.1 predicted protein [Laccaria bicolor S238N-H82]|eukprot:XP_001885538.1 predicted protein [Laccaria bicolor S238N-H82]
MGKLNIAHHKSYHPYRRDNIEKVRRDEEEAQLKEAKEEGRMSLADSEARIQLLRERAASDKPAKKKQRGDDDMKAITAGSSMQPAALPTTKGHINFFEDLEHNAIAAAIKATKKATPAETEKGVALAPSAKDLKPWYSASNSDKTEEVEDERRKRDEFRKSAHDPLTSITKQLASRPPSSSSSYHSRPALPSHAPSAPPEVQARLSREMSERERAQELIRRKRREMQGGETPSAVHGGSGSAYGDVFNRKEVEEAHRERDRGSRRRYDDDRRRHGEGSRQWAW